MMRSLLFALLLPTGLHALTDADCQARVDAVLALTGPVVTVDGTRADGDWCVVTAPSVKSGEAPAPTFRADEVRFRLTGAPSAPITLDVQMQDMRTLIDVQGNPAMSWLLQQQMGPLGVDADLSLSRDPAARTLSVDVLHIDFPGQNDIRLTGMIGDLDLDAVAANPETVLTANLRNLDLTVVTEGLFETVVLMPLGTIVLDGSTDPEGDVDRLKRLATGIIDRLPDTLTDMPSRAAMTALVMDMPHPWGTVSLQVNADPGLGAVRMVGPALNGPPETLDGWLALLNGVRVTFGYQPHAQDDAE